MLSEKWCQYTCSTRGCQRPSICKKYSICAVIKWRAVKRGMRIVICDVFLSLVPGNHQIYFLSPCEFDCPGHVVYVLWYSTCSFVPDFFPLPCSKCSFLYSMNQHFILFCFYGWIVFYCVGLVILFVHSLGDEHFGCFYFLAIINNTGVNTHV